MLLNCLLCSYYKINGILGQPAVFSWYTLLFLSHSIYYITKYSIEMIFLSTTKNPALSRVFLGQRILHPSWTFKNQDIGSKSISCLQGYHRIVIFILGAWTISIKIVWLTI